MRGRRRARRPPRRAWLVPSAALAAATLAGCGARASGGDAAGHSRPETTRTGVSHPLRVVATAFPLAQLVKYVGGADVTVTDLVPPGLPPQSLTLSAGARARLGAAQLVVELGDGFQPQVEAAGANKPHVALLPALSRETQPYEVWLDPYLWSKAAGVVAKALQAADPAGKTVFDNGARDFRSLASSISSDYQNSLSQCPLRDFVTSDTAFSRMASAFSLVDIPVSTTGVQKTLATIAQYSIPGVFSEQGVPSSALLQVAAAAHVKSKVLDPMELTPEPGAKYESYFSVMEDNLSALEGPLECDTSSTYF